MAADKLTPPAPAKRPATSSARKRRDTSWQLTPEGQRAHVEGYGHWRAIEGAAKAYGSELGYAFLALLARRLMVVDEDSDGARPTAATAWSRVEGWWRAGQTAEAVGARRARAA